MTSLTHRLDRSISINAPRETVFRYFTDSTRWATWWGTGSTIDARIGGRVYIRHPGNVEVSGEVLEVKAPERIVFSYGYESGAPFGPGQSRVTIALAATQRGTHLTLSQEFPDEAARDEHVQGWRYQLAVFGNVVANELHAHAADKTDAWFQAWRETDSEARRKMLAEIANPDIRYRDRYSLTDGIDDLIPHISAAQHFMPGVFLERQGDVRHCQGTVLADWAAIATDGRTLDRGVNVFVFGADARIESVTGLATPRQP